MSSAALAEARASENRLRHRFQQISAKKKEALREGLAVGLQTGVGFGLGYVDGAFPDRSKIVGFPLSFVTGSLGVTAAILDLGGSDTSSYLLDVGKAGMTVWGYQAGFGFGQKK